MELKITNSLSGNKEIFKPIIPGRIGMYVCGPTVYNDVHLGNCRTFVNFDMIYRFLVYSGYKVRYVRNITDVGHLLDDGEDRMLKGARLEQLEPMEVAQKYSNGFHDMMRIFNTIPPSIEPRASGHVPEQIEMVQAILDNGYGYIKNGSVYFDTVKFAKTTDAYGKLSGRVLDDLLTETRDLNKQDEKNHPSDFAIWIKASPEHIMRWNSPWSEGFPGWHLECSAMSTKYLGKTFDIHGGGNDLKFPHHENEVAQNMGSCKCQPANYWMHANMLLLNGTKMSKSLGNTISPEELFTGNSEHISKGYSPMVIRFFFLQAHYTSPLNITDDALQAAEKGYRRLMEGIKILNGLAGLGAEQAGALDAEVLQLLDQVSEDMNDDFNVPKAMSRIFELVTKVNALKGGQLSLQDISNATLARMLQTISDYVFQVFGLADEMAGDKGADVLDGLMRLVIDIRQDARVRKDWPTSDKVRDTLAALKIQLKDGKDGTEWSVG